MATTLHLGDCSTDCAQCIANCSCDNCLIICNACGQFINATEQDSEKYHRPELCPANDELEDGE